MNLVHSRLYPVALPVATLGAAPGAIPTIGLLRKQLKTRLDALRSYDLFLRDRSTWEWYKDSAPLIRWLRAPSSVAQHDESHQFWAHLGEAEKRQFIGEWMKLVERGVQLAGDARQGGIGLGYGPAEPAPPKRAAATDDWLQEADAFIGRFEKERQRMRVESRVNPSTTTSYLRDALKPLAWTLGLGAVGVLAVVLLMKPRVSVGR